METNTLKRTSDVQLSRILKTPRLSGDDSDSAHSIQQQDTDCAQDTSDTSIDSDMTEYEVGHMSPDVPNPFFSTDDSDEINEINEIAELGAVVAAVSCNWNDIDVGQLADSSTEISTSPTSNSDVDPELPRLDYLYFWTCAQCKAVNENRHVPFCSRCYTMRKTFFPPRPRRRRLHKNRQTRAGAIERVESVSEKAASSVETNIVLSKDSGVSSQDGDVVDGPIRSQGSASGGNNREIESQGSCVSGTSRGGDSGADFTSQEVDMGNGPTTPDSQNCQICLLRPADGLFSHGSTTHRYACYGCSKVTWRRIGRCPLCRRKIDRVTKLL